MTLVLPLTPTPPFLGAGASPFRLLLARAAPPCENLAVQQFTLARFRPCRKTCDFGEERGMRWEITFVMTVCDAESIGVVFARVRTPNPKNWCLPIAEADIGGPLAKI